MPLRNAPRAWGWPARLLHWLTAGVILFLLGLGFWMTQVVTDMYAQFDLIQIHKSWGFVAFALALLRLVWRATHPAPPPVPGAPAWQTLAAEGAHWALYALMIAMPLSGWLMASASSLQDSYGIKNMVFGLFALPDPFQPGDRALEKVFGAIHFYCAWAMIALLVAHAGAALKHHFVDRDEVLRRMTWPRRG
ncbi:cytochrome b [Albimonas sp. CAU 1670]|uniref:cytochrome b n=1 Tax=Albimonas sp. CAU 1670 TaxID=3032599 RepID=UPI0023DA679D|nr:cytochrome b [Albimonas sp. CAU 1670]MDF2231639.1 cytochrome b [Albimonas sp. CAU 1670]